MYGIIIVFFFLFLFLLYNKIESFHGHQLFWNTSPTTRNMSYDLRCEPRINKANYPFMGSSIELPPQYKCLDF